MRSVLARATSTKGTARQFIKTNAGRVEALMVDIHTWFDSFGEEYGFEYSNQGDGRWSLSGLEGDGAVAFQNFLVDQWRDFEPYAVTEDVLIDVDGITIEDEPVLAPLYLENQEAFIKADKERATPEAEEPNAKEE